MTLTPVTCAPAHVGAAGALYVPGTLILFAQGNVSTACESARIVQRPERILPPMYEVQSCRPTDVACADVVKRYGVVELFRLGEYPDEITIWHATGQQRVKVRKLSPQGDGTVSIAEEGPIPIPFAETTKLRCLLCAEDEAVGYSAAMSLDEAFRDAVANLPPEPATHPDQMRNVRVTYQGALFGGFVGWHHAVVRVSRRSD